MFCQHMQVWGSCIPQLLKASFLLILTSDLEHANIAPGARSLICMHVFTLQTRTPAHDWLILHGFMLSRIIRYLQTAHTSGACV